MSEPEIRTRDILGVNIAISSYAEVAKRSIAWAATGDSRVVFYANVHMIMEARDHPDFRAMLNAADMVNSDGMPLVWALRGLGERTAKRVYGPDATEVLLAAAEDARIPVGFYGGDSSTLATLLERVRRRHPQLNIAYVKSPPFHPLSAAEDEEIVRELSASGARILFVGLGCPKQERWIMEHRGRISAVMHGVGAAFDFLAGTKPQAPRWIMRAGLEWLFRLASEPGRLADRYLRNNPRFVMMFVQEWVRFVAARRS
ncbi:MAG TPA: WecB/TagA/CpsF family glycosyltransferase [Terracidiphilus sp.]|nr:WecB/TagA/CpsF family glycosyltransferase [Terracidiphilus sp.]